jgi:hypothetical protein
MHLNRTTIVFICLLKILKIFIGILFLSGYHRLPRERLYWSLDEDVKVKLVSNAMSRNRFEEIKRYLHLADNTKLDKRDKMAKVRPMMNLLNQKFLQWGIFHEALSIDEAMIKYFGHHTAKQFIRGKPIRFGYKNWMLCAASGYCYGFDTYCGAKFKSTDEPKSKSTLPLGSQVVLDLLEKVNEPSSHIIFFDNYFTSYDLISTLRKSGFRATGTLRENRSKKCPLLSTKEMKKKDRGYFEYVFDKTNSILITRWKDNNVVTMASNYDSVAPLSKVKRWSSATKEKLEVPQPRVFSNYNSYMGGVDLLDQATNNYRISIKGKKWWWVLFTHMLNVTMVNAWKLYLHASSTKCDLLDFMRNISRHYLTCFQKSSYIRRRPIGTVPESIIQDKGGHFPQELQKQLRCRQCGQRARWHCIKCKVTLCLERNCFIVYHT